MKQHFLCIAFIFGSSLPALADLTGRDLWNTLKTQLEGPNAASVSAQEDDIEDGFAVSNIRRAFVGGARHEINSTLKFVERADGSVSIVLPDRLDATFVTAKQVKTFISVTPQDVSIVASGTPDAIALDVAGRAVTFDQGSGANSDTGITVNTFALSQILGTLSFEDREPRVLGSKFTIGLLDSTRLSEARGGRLPTYRSTISDIEFGLNGRIPTEAPIASMGPMFSNPNTAMTLTLRHGLAADFDAALGNASEGLSSVKRGFHLAQISKGRANLSASMIDATGVLNIGEFHSSIGIGRMRIGADIALFNRGPYTTNSMSLHLKNVTVPDQLRAKFDPTGVLPDAPGQFNLDLETKGQLSAALMMNLRPDLRSSLIRTAISKVSIEKLALSALGAKMSAKGQFTMDPDKQADAPGRAFEGTADVNLTGGEAAIGAFETLKLIPESQAGMLRVFLNLFATRNGAKDQFTSRISWEKDGRVIANGRMVQLSK